VGAPARRSALSAGGQALQPGGQLLADLAAFARDLLVEHQLEGIEMGLGDLEAGLVGGAARPITGTATGRGASPADSEAAPWPLMLCIAGIEQIELPAPPLGRRLGGVEQGCV